MGLWTQMGWAAQAVDGRIGHGSRSFALVQVQTAMGRT